MTPVSASRVVAFGQVAAAAASLLKVPSDQMTALHARMKNLQRVGLLEGLETQRGKATPYTGRQALELLLGTALNYDGMMPEHIVFLISRRRETLHKTAEAGKLLIFHPEGALHSLQGPPVRKQRALTLIWPVGALREHLLSHLPH